ncbi:MAG: DNA mismatch repair endonuclease MutL [Ruminococcaceae bacterium]|nr:DNA mismatch repair endonuclease MutL [Oscillospiraceae bacterium]
MGKINLLSFEVANLIAAGEVVDRPASAVKELLENAIDSGATQITLEIQRGGVSFIRVSDNGCGIEKEDLIPAITRHSTSKISSAADLSSIFTLGFRGEALAAIASVSRLRIFSKLQGQVLGAVLEAEGGKGVSVSDTGCQEGTTVIVEDLFFNVPARRKFLKKDSTEATAIGAVVEKIALSHPEISFKFISDGEIKFMTAGNGNLRDTIWALFGKDTARRALKVDREEGGIRITGYVSEPDLYRSNRNMENFFINGRYIKSKTATAAIEQAYASKIPADKFPFCVLNIQINPSAVDVNVHPAKLEVKFANEKVIFDAVYYAVLSALEAEAQRPELQLSREKNIAQNPYKANAEELRRAFAPLDRGTPAAKQVRFSDISPRRDEANQKVTPQIADEISPADRAARYFDLAGTPVMEKGKPVITREFPEPQKAKTEEIELTYIPLPTDEDAPPAFDIAPEAKVEKEAIPASKSAVEPVTKAVVEPVTEAKSDDPYSQYDSSIDPSDIPEYHIIGEAFNCYVIVQIDDRILMIDKHAAHERIIFDELCRKMRANLRDGKAKDGQLLFAPIELDMLAGEVEAMKDYEDKIRALGFDYTFEKTGVSSYKAVITQIPGDLDNAASIELFTTLMSKLSDVTASVESTAEGFFESRLWQASCKAAIKGGRIYDMGHIKWICDRLLKKPDEKSQVIRTCPHGRPVAFEIKKSSIDRQFARLT